MEGNCDNSYVALFKRKVKDLILDLLDKSGAVLYSSYCTLKRGDFYILGFNPGGDPKGIKETVRADLESEKKLNPSYNEYTKENWGKGPGKSLLQKRIQKLVQELLDRRIEDICASNLVFIRSKGERDIPNWWEMANRCWKVHEFLIYEIVQPKVIISFGIETYNFLKEKFSSSKGNFIIPSGWGNWTIRGFSIENGPRNELVVIGFPHFSRYYLSKLIPEDFKKLKEIILQRIKKD